MPSLPLSRRTFLRRATIASAAGLLPRSSVRAASSSATAPPGKPRPNFIIILADDMGYADTSINAGWIKTPHLEALAREGLRFTDFHSSGAVCSPTRAGLMTGRYQERAGIPGVINADPKTAVHHHGLYPKEVTFPRLLKKAGYTSAIFGKWHLGYTRNFNPIRHGFDRFRGYVSGNIDYVSHYDRMGTYDWWEGLELIKEDGYTTELIAKHGLAFLEQHKDRPFCLYLAHEAVHSPFQAPGDPAQRGPREARGPRGATRPTKQTYALMMEALDETVGQVVAKVKQLGLAERTLIWFFSDNGAMRVGSNAPLRGFKGSVWEGGHRVPAVAWWPGTVKPGTTTDQLCISLDIMPTMLDLAGAAVPKGHKLDGASLARLLREGKGPGPRKLFWRGQAMRDGTWKLVVTGRRDDQASLFDLSKDIGETEDLATKHPDRVKKMLAELAAWRKDVAAGATPQTAPESIQSPKAKPRKKRRRAGDTE